MSISPYVFIKKMKESPHFTQIQILKKESGPNHEVFKFMYRKRPFLMTAWFKSPTAWTLTLTDAKLYNSIADFSGSNLTTQKVENTLDFYLKSGG